LVPVRPVKYSGNSFHFLPVSRVQNSIAEVFDKEFISGADAVDRLINLGW
jgi:hypothetical protein